MCVLLWFGLFVSGFILFLRFTFFVVCTRSSFFSLLSSNTSMIRIQHSPMAGHFALSPLCGSHQYGREHSCSRLGLNMLSLLFDKPLGEEYRDQGVYMLNFYKKLKVVIVTFVHSHQRCLRVPVLSYPRLHLMLSGVFFSF